MVVKACDDAPGGAVVRMRGAERTDAELLAVAVFGGNVARAKALLVKVGGLRGIKSAPDSAFGEITRAQRDRLFAVMALEERHLRERMNGEQYTISEPSAVLDYFRGTIQDLKVETFRVLLLNKAHKIIKEFNCGLGTIDRTAVHPREIVRACLEAHASALVLVHNHPSGRAEPSGEDCELTRRMVAMCEGLGLKVLDHLIIAGDNKYSFREHGIL